MRRTPGYRSRNVDDRRHRAAGGRGGASLLPLLFLLGRSRIGLLAILLIGGLLWLGGVDPLMLLTGGGAPASRVTPARDAAEAEMVDLVNVVFDDLQATWGRLLAGGGPAYREATLVLFRDAVESACGFAQSASGPFYCPGDEQIYIDLGFYEELRRGLGAPGDFAQAYVLAHEVGHHVQNVLGIEREVRALQRGRPEHVNPLSVRLELQADCFAGVWGRHADQQGLLDPGDLEEGLNAAAAIGDDRLQRSAGRTVNPDLFTHGSAAQRVSWLRRGFEGGEPSVCDTFADAG